MTRREAREAIVSTLFSYEYTPEKTAEELNAERIGVLGGKEDAYIAEAIGGVLDITITFAN